MATYSTILAWGILWTEEPGELQVFFFFSDRLVSIFSTFFKISNSKCKLFLFLRVIEYSHFKIKVKHREEQTSQLILVIIMYILKEKRYKPRTAHTELVFS